MACEDGFGVVKEVVADCLGLDEEEFGPSSRLIDDLGADSLDYVDLLFTLEKRFGIQLRKGDLDLMSLLDASDPNIMRDGYLTPDTVQRITRWLPKLRDSATAAPVSAVDVFRAITVADLWRAIEQQIAAGSRDQS